MTDNTINARSQALRKRRKDAGMIRFERWVPADKLQAVKDAIDKIMGETNDA